MNTWPNAVITEKGLALLAKLTQGNTLRLTGALAGDSFTKPVLLIKETRIASPKQVLTFKAATYPEVGKCKITLTLTNENLDTGYVARQVGVFAQDPDEGEILFLIVQAADTTSGTIVPSEAEMPGYSAEWSLFFRYGQADGVAVAVDPSNTVSREEMEDYIKNEFVPISAEDIDAILAE